MTEPRADPSRFDPRFDPAFQPGYDPRNDPAAPARSTPRRFEAAPPTRMTPPDRVVPLEYPPPGQGTAPMHPTARTESEAEDSGIDELFVERETADDPAPDRGVNPFVVTLWVASIVLIAAGITVFRSIPGLEQQGSLTTGPETTVSFVQTISLSILGPILIGTGVLVAVGNIFLLAARWPRRENQRGDGAHARRSRRD